ncbi:hemagglutinin [Opitutaceae bacterium TAV5]|nr:hemagglutinin [Opitutaceae bacterium TAV5]
MTRKNHKTRFVSAVFMSALTLLGQIRAYAGPGGGQVVAGSANISANGASTSIHQLSDKAIINWNSFSIGAGESVRFIQPGAAAVALNRVTGKETSNIQGALTANGNIFLVNPNGILFGAGARVDVAGLMASTFDISNASFMAGKYNFAQNPAADPSFVINRGQITVGDNGFVYLVAPSVHNSGLIVANMGQVALASGDRFTVDFGGDGLVKFDVSGQLASSVKGPDGRTLASTVSNDGTISAPGGRVVLTGDAARDIVTSVVNNTGIVEATSIAGLGGSVQLVARGDGDVINTGSISVSSAANGAAAGSVELRGGNVGQFGTITADGLGHGDAGSIDLHASQVVAVGADSVTTASAGENGDGGSIRIVGENSARIATGATLAARGGALAGDGGFVETSGYESFSIGATPDVSAANGAAGLWLIDPHNITIVAGSTNIGIDTANPFASTADGAQLGVDLILGALASGNVAITTSGDEGSEAGNITLATALTYTGINARSLTLNAHNSIFINNALTSTGGALNLTLNANNATGGGVASGSGAVSVGAAINTNGGSFTSTGINFNNTAVGAITTGNGAVNIGNTGAVSVAGTINAGSGAITINQASSIGISAGVTTSGTAALAASNGNITTSGSGQITAGTLNLTTTRQGATIGAEGNALRIDAGTLNANANFGHIVITDTAGGVAVGTIDTGGDKGDEDATRVILTAQNGSITASGSGTNITGWAANLVADQAVGTAGSAIKTHVTVLTGSTQDGGFYVADQEGQIRLGKITVREGGVTPLIDGDGNVVLGIGGSAGTHDIRISAASDIFLTDEIVSPDELTLTSAGGSIYDASETNNFIARTLTLNAAGDVGQAGNAIDSMVETFNASSGGSIYLTESNALTIGNITASGAGSQVSVVVNSGDIRLGSITANGSAVTVESKQGSIIDNNGTAVNIIADTAVLNAQKAIGAAGTGAIGTNVSALEARSATTGQGIYLKEENTLSSLLVSTNNGAVNVAQQGGSLIFNPTNGALSLTADSAPSLDFTNSGGQIMVGGLNLGAQSLRLQALGSITQSGSTPIVANDATLVAGTNIGSSAAPVLTNVKSLDLTSTSGGSYISQQGSSDLTLTANSGGAVEVAAQGGDLLLKTVSASGAVKLATSGSLLGSSDNPDGTVNVTAASADLHAGGSIGTDASPLSTAVSGSLATRADNGGIYLSNSGDISLLSAQATGGAVKVANFGNATLGEIVAQGNAVVLSVSGNITDGNGNTRNIVGSSLDIRGRSIGTSTDAVEIAVGQLTAETTDGGLYLNSTDPAVLRLTSAKAAGSNIGITAKGDVQLGTIEAAGATVSLSSEGAIEDARTSTSVPNVKAKTLEIAGAQGVGVNSTLSFDVGFLSASGGTGGVSAANLSPVSVDSASLTGKGAAGVNITAPTIYILDNNGGTITMDAGGSLVLIAQKGNIVFLNPNDTIIVPGGGSITLDASYVDNVLPGNSGVIIAGNLKTTNGGSIRLVAGSHITIGLLDAGYDVGDVYVESKNGLIIDGNGSATNIIGKNVTLMGKTPSEYVAELIRDMAIADYTGKVAEAGADLTTVQSLTGMRDVYAQTVSLAQSIERLLLNELNQTQRTYNTENTKLEIYQAIYNTLAVVRAAAQVAKDAASFPAAGAQAIPFSGDGGASVAEAAVALAFSLADAAMLAYNLSTLSPQDSKVADLANALDVARAAYFTAQTDLANSTSSLKATNTALNIAQAALTAAEIARDASELVRSQAVTAYNLTASGNIIGTASQPLGVEASKVNIQTFNKSSVYLESPGKLGLGDIEAVGAGTEIVVRAVSDINVLGEVISPTRISLTSTGGGILGGGGTLIANDLVAIAANGIGVANAVNTEVDRLAAFGGTGGGVRFVNDKDGGVLTIDTIDGVTGVSGAGDILLDNAGDLKLSSAIVDTTETHTVTLTSEGDIIDDNGVSTNVTGGTLIATATGNIELDTKVAKATARSTDAGNITLRETDAVELTDITANNGVISVVAGGSIDAVKVVSSTDAAANTVTITANGGGNIRVGKIAAGETEGIITLTATGRIDDDNDNATKITGKDLFLTAANGIGDTGANGTRALDTAVTNLTASVTAAGAIHIAEDDDLNVLSVATPDGNVTLTSATGNLNITRVQADGAGNTVTLGAGGAIIDATDEDDANVIAANLAMGAGAGIGAADKALQTKVDNLEAAVAAGGIYVTDQTGDLTIGDVIPNLALPALSGLQATTGDIVVKAADSIIINEGIAAQDGDVTLTATAGSITGRAGITHVSSADFNATAATGIGTDTTPLKTAVDTLTAAVTDAGLIRINEQDAIELTDVTAADGSITVTAGGSIDALKVVSSTDAGSNDITLTATTGDIRVISIAAGSTSGNIALTALTGRINDDNDNTTKITGNALTLTAANGIGVVGLDLPEDDATRALDTAVNALTATVTTAGVINVAEDDDLNVLSVTTPDGNVTLTSATGNLNVTAIAAHGAGNTVTLGAGGAITDATDEDDANVIAANLAMGAGAGIGAADKALQTKVDNLEAEVAAGGIYVTDQTGDLTIGDVMPNLSLPELSGLRATAGDIVVKAADSIIINEGIAADDGDVKLTATAGSITGRTGITHVSGKDFNATSATGIGTTATPLNTAVDTLTAAVTGAGSINLNEADAIELTDVTTANGPITITAGGTITAVNVTSVTDRRANDITLTATNGGSIVIDTVNAGTRSGDVTLTANTGAGTVTTRDGGRVTGDHLDVTAAAGIDLTTTVNRATLAVTGSGAITIDEQDAIRLQNVTTANGPITVTAGGNIRAVNVVSTTDDDANDIALTATNGGSIVIDTVDAGTGSGDVTLTANTGTGTLTTRDGGRVTGDNLTATAAAGIDLDTTVNRATLAVTGAGSIDINEQDAIELTDVSAANGPVKVVAGGSIDAVKVVSATDAAANTIDLTATTGSIRAGTITAGATSGNITLTAADRIDDDNDNTTKISGNALTLVAANGIGSTGANATRALDTAVNSLTATVTAAGAINVTDDDNLDVLSVTTPDGNVTLASATGNLNVTTITAAGAGNTVTLSAGRAITDAAADASSNITAAHLAMTAGTGIGSAANALETTVDNLEAKTTTGGIYVTDLTGNLTIGGVTPNLGQPALSGLHAGSGDIVVKSAGSLVITEGIAAQDGDVKLTASTGSITGAAGVTHVSGKDFVASSVTGIGTTTTAINTAVDSLTASVSNVGLINVNEQDAIELTSVTTANGPITVAAGGTISAVNVVSATDAGANGIDLTSTGGDIVVDYVAAGEGTSGDVTLVAAGAINQRTPSDAGTDIVADVLTLQAGAGIGVTGALDIAANTLAASSTTGGINLAERDNIILTQISAANGDVAISAGGYIADDNDNATRITAKALTLTAADGIGAIGAAGTRALDTSVDSLVATTGAGDIHIDENSGIHVISAVTPSGNITINAAAGNIDVSTIEATAPGATVTLAAAGGAIRDARNDDASNITAANLSLTATAGVGEAANALDVTTGRLTASGGTGGVYINNLSAGLILDGVQTTLGDIGVRTPGQLTVAAPVINSGNGSIALITTDTGGNGDTIVVNAPVTALGGGSILLNADDSVQQNADLEVNGRGSITVTATDDIVMAPGAKTTAGNGSVSYLAGDELVLTHIDSSTDRVNGGTVNLAAAKIVNSNPDDATPAITGAFLNIDSDSVNLAQVRNLIGKAKDLTGITLNDRLVGGYISNDASFYNSIIIESMTGRGFDALFRVLGTNRIDSSSFAVPSTQAPADSDTWEFVP